jgi:hypothetical protein
LPLLAVFAVGFIEIWFAVPTGLYLFGLPAPLVWILTSTGAFTSVTLVAFGGDALRYRLTHGNAGEPVRRPGRIRAAWMRLTHSDTQEGGPRTGRIYRVWLRYGVPGWGLASPLFMTPPMGTAVALILGAPRRSLLVWMYAGTALWTTILVSAAMIGLRVFDSIH